jgi:tetratricopeptide (TPR) repeat protein
MYHIIPLILILISLIIIMVIVIRKFPQLAILDVENMPSEKAEKIKERIIKSRLERDFTKWNVRLLALGQAAAKRLNFFSNWLNRLRELKAQHQEEKKLASISLEEKIELFLNQARELAKKEDLESLVEAESKLIEIVSLNQKYLPAFIELGEVYAKLKKFTEAKQTFIYALRLLEFKNDPKAEAEINYQLSLANENLDNLDEARDNIIESLKIEPNHPRYLNTLLDITILEKDKTLAQETLDRLSEVNPENQKLGEWQGVIDNL